MTDLVWPERPACHGERSQYTGDLIAWRAPRIDESGPYSDTFRTCSWCGSIHPEDLYNAMKAGVARLGGSDWKYGWPHKFYVYGIPNPKAGQTVEIGSSYENRVNTPIMGAAPQFLHAKWYNEHLTDLSPECFSAMAELLHNKSRILFTKKDGKLAYSAPYAGFQALGDE